MRDVQLRARIPQHLFDELKNVIEELNESIPIAEITVSSITREALRMYIDQININKKRSMVIEIPTIEMSTEQLDIAEYHLKEISKLTPEGEVKKFNRIRTEFYRDYK